MFTKAINWVKGLFAKKHTTPASKTFTHSPLHRTRSTVAGMRSPMSNLITAPGIGQQTDGSKMENSTMGDTIKTKGVPTN